MKKIIPILAIIILYSCENDELINDSKTAQKETAETSIKSLDLPEGCPYSYDDYNAIESDFVVNNITELKTAITNSVNGNIIYLNDNVTFSFAESDLPIIINKSIKIVSNRNQGGSEGAILHNNFVGQTMFKVEANDVTFSGVRIFGHSTNIFPSSGETTGIEIDYYDRLVVENCEIKGWFLAGVKITNSKQNKIISNYIHHNRRAGLGYGVAVYNDASTETDVLISCNNFEYNRHDISASGSEEQSYEASYNIIGEPGDDGVNKTHRFDVHGKNGGTEEVAGKHFKIHNNTFLYERDRDIPIRIGGIPQLSTDINNNTFAQKCKRHAIEQRTLNNVLNQENWVSMNVSSNTYSGEAINNINLDNYFLAINEAYEFQRYDFGNECNCYNEKVQVAHTSPSIYKKFYVGNWVGNSTDDVLALTHDNKLILFPYNNSTFYGQGGPIEVPIINPSSYVEFYVGNWTNNGTDDLIGLTNTGQFILLPFNGTSFGGPNYGNVIGHVNPSTYTKFFSGQWTGNGTNDLIGLTNSGDFYLFPFNNSTFYGQGGASHVGSIGSNTFKNFYVGKFKANGSDDLMGWTDDDQIILFPFSSNTFQPSSVIAVNFIHYKDFIVHKSFTSQADEFIFITNNNRLKLFQLESTLYNRQFIGCVKEYELFLGGKWK
ncbi:hypothetical protein [Kordia sp.]|uniref:hypothetical protein n=1 Tax=Kordia sp. TaxID=1965332 RepID=UPI003D6B3186